MRIGLLFTPLGSRTLFTPLALLALIAGASVVLGVPPALAMPPFTLQTVDAPPGGRVGESSSMKVDRQGHPHIAYYDGLNGNLKYAYHDGTSWTIQVADGSLDDVGAFCSLALDALDRPHIAYYDDTNGRLLYATRVGTTWTREIADTSSFDSGWFPSIAIDRAGRPWIASYDHGSGNPRISERLGTGWVGETIDTTTNLSGLFASLALDSLDQPHVAYYDLTDRKLIYATKRLNAARTKLVWAQETADSSADDVGLFASIAVDRFSRVHVAYMDLSSADLRWALRDPTTGSWRHETVHGGPEEVGYDCSLVLDPVGFPNIAYHNGTAGTLVLARQDASGWNLKTVDDSPGVVGLYSSVGTDAQGNIRISYWDGTAYDLKFAWGPSEVAVGVPPPIGRVPRALALSPNPARAGERVRFLAGEPGVGAFELLDVAGRLVARLEAEGGAAEWNMIASDGTRVAPGLYLARAVRADGRRGAGARLIVVR